MNRTSLSCLATRRTRSSASGTLRPALGPGRGLLVAFSLPRPLPSPASAAGEPALFDGFAGTTGLSDFSRPCISGVPPKRSLSGPTHHHQNGRP